MHPKNVVHFITQSTNALKAHQKQDILFFDNFVKYIMYQIIHRKSGHKVAVAVETWYLSIAHN